VRVIHRARGWHATWTGIISRRSLRGDTPGLVAALHALNDAGLLPANPVTPEWASRGPCPRCGRLTAVRHWGDVPTVCAACRAEWIADQLEFVTRWNQWAYIEGHRSGKCCCYKPVGHTADCAAVLRGWVT
jgi:hypothetical protein